MEYQKLGFILPLGLRDQEPGSMLGGRHDSACFRMDEQPGRVGRLAEL